MTIVKRILLAVVVAVTTAVAAHAADNKPAIIFGPGGKIDNALGASAFQGAERFKAKTGVAYRQFTASDQTQRERMLHKFARDGNSPIIVVGAAFAPVLRTVAGAFPETKFGIVDATVDQPNVRSMVFGTAEGAWLAGVMAAKLSNTGTVALLANEATPAMQAAACAYAGGVKTTNADANVLRSMTGTMPAAPSNPVAPGEAGTAQADAGDKPEAAQPADVVYMADKGVLRTIAAPDGTDTNPLTSGARVMTIVRHANIAVYDAFMDGWSGKFATGVIRLGLKDHGISYTFERHSAVAVTRAMRNAVATAKSHIVSGTIAVPASSSDTPCPH